MILADCSESESNSTEAAIPNSALAAIAKAYVWQEQLESGQFESLEDIAKKHKVDRSYVGRIMQLTSLGARYCGIDRGRTDLCKFQSAAFPEGHPGLMGRATASPEINRRP